MGRVFWLIRVTAFAVIGILALISPAHSAEEQAVQIACFSAVGLALLVWGAAEVSPRYRTWGLPAALGVIAVAGGVAGVTSGAGQSLVALSFVAVSWAASDTDPPVWITVAASGAVTIWLAGAIVGASFGTMAGYPLLIVVCLLLGLNRRNYRVRAEQSAALLAQHEQLRAEQRRADVLDERTRIAREIHDVLAHSLGALGIQIQAAKAMLTDHGDVDRAVEALTTAQRMAADGLTETRRAVHALRVDTLPLGDELADAVETYRQRYHVPATLTTSGAARAVPPDAALALLRTAQEAMVNAAKHAPGQQVTVRLDYGENDVRLSVVNRLNGSGTVVRRLGSSTGGYGLTGLGERLRLLNGTLMAGPRENPGENPAEKAEKAENEWAVTAELPLARADDGLAAAKDGIAR
jgi:signal transduction histidine kinase